MARDARGLEMAGAPESVAAFDRAVWDYWTLGGDPVGQLQAALAGDSDFTLGATTVAALFLVGGFPPQRPEVQAVLRAGGVASSGASPRELCHLEAVEAWAEGRLADAAAVYEDILLDHPRDALALRLAQDLYFTLGGSEAMRDSAARVIPEWDESDPLHSFLLGAHAFGLEETGDYVGAEARARAALARQPADVWTAHALAHVYEMTSRPEEGLAFLQQSRPQWAGAHFMAGHNGWHAALYLIELGRFNEVLAGFDALMAPRLKDDATLDRIDAASLLWRLELEGVDVGARWAPVRRAWAPHLNDHVSAFNDLHLALAAAGDSHLAAMLSGSLDAYAAEATGDNAAVTAGIGRPLIEAMLAFGEGDFGGCVELLLPLRYNVWRIGGSHAQRDLVSLTLIAAAERSGERALARALLAERAALRPSPRWRERWERARSGA